MAADEIADPDIGDDQDRARRRLANSGSFHGAGLARRCPVFDCRQGVSPGPAAGPAAIFDHIPAICGTNAADHLRRAADWGKGRPSQGSRARMFLVTGGAGFIGSNVVASLNEAGRTDVVVNDVLGHDDAKWRNLAKRQLADFVPPAELPRWLEGRKLDAVIHMGAISDTTATDGDLVMENNFRLSLRLLDWCTATPHAVHLCLVGGDLWRRRAGLRRRLVARGVCKRLRPMNLYGWSKHLFDQARGRPLSQERQAAAAMGRAEILQRVRPERISQGRHGERAGQASSTTPRRASRSSCSSRTATASPTATSAATSSMSTMSSRCCAGCWRRPRSAASSMSAPARRAASAT